MGSGPSCTEALFLRLHVVKYIDIPVAKKCVVYDDTYHHCFRGLGNINIHEPACST